MHLSALRSGASAFCLALFALPAMAEESHSHIRVVIGDHAAPRVTLFDLDSPEAHWNFDTAGQAKPYVVADGAVIALVQSDADRVQFLSSGIRLEDHGDHADLEVSDPVALEEGLTGPRPFHLIDHEGEVAINFDAGGYGVFLANRALAEGRIDPVTFNQDRAHHGFITRFGPLTLSTLTSGPAEGDASAPPRLGLQASDREGQAIGAPATCTAIHGEAFSGAYLAAGCREGVLTVRLNEGAPEYALLPYPDDFPQGTTGTLHGGAGMQVFLGNHGATGLVVIDPAEEPHMRRFELPARRVDFLLDPSRAATGYALTEDGQLHRIDLLEAAIARSAPATAAYSMDGHWNDPRPRLAVAGDEVLVTDPNAGLLRRFDAATLAPLGEITVEGLPYTIAAISASGAQH